MTNDNLQQLLAAIQMSEDGDFLRVLAETTLNRLMDFDADNTAGAARHERSPDRTTYRNGYRDRVLETRRPRRAFWNLKFGIAMATATGCLKRGSGRWTSKSRNSVPGQAIILASFLSRAGSWRKR
jgi:hypothetical protein